MDLLSPKIIKELLAKYGAAPLKRMGQNFLINKGVLEKIIQAANLSGADTILEIGPGLGVLTKELAKRAKKVAAIEKDRKFVQILKETLTDYKNVEVIEDDILKTKKLKLLTKNYKLISNLPYNITSPVIRKYLEAKNKPKEMILMVQKEVAQRICSQPPDMSLLAASVQFYAQPKILDYISKGSFWPQPKVDSAIIKITPYSDPNIKIHQNDQNIFFKIVKAGFSAPRKQLAGNLAKKLGIKKEVTDKIMQKMGIDPKRRAETLNVEDWAKIAKEIERL